MKIERETEDFTEIIELDDLGCSIEINNNPPDWRVFPEDEELWESEYTQWDDSYFRNPLDYMSNDWRPERLWGMPAGVTITGTLKKITYKPKGEIMKEPEAIVDIKKFAKFTEEEKHAYELGLITIDKELESYGCENGINLFVQTLFDSDEKSRKKFYELTETIWKAKYGKSSE